MRAAYRFFAVYLALFSVASQFLGGLILFPGFQFPALGRVWPMRAVTEFVGTNVFSVTNFDVYGTSADTAFHWVQLAWIAAVSLIVAIATTVRLKADTTNTRAPVVSAPVVSGFSRTDYWFRLFLRFVLAAQMFYF